MKYDKKTDKKGNRIDSKKNRLNSGEYERTDGRYYFRYKDGHKTCFVYAPDLETLREKEKQIERDIEDSISSIDGRKTLNQMYHYFSEIRTDLRDSTRTNHNNMWNANVENSKLGKMKVSEIKKPHILELCNGLSRKGLKRSTIKYIHGLISYTLDRCVECDCIRKNVAKGVMKEFGNDAEEKEPLTESEYNALLDYCRKNNVYKKYVSFLVIAVGTCCRVGELTGLTWNDVNLKDRTISINHQLAYRNYGKGTQFSIEHPKTDAGKRLIPMTEEVYKAFVEIRKDQMANGFCNMIIDGYTGFVFINSNNMPYATNAVNRFLSDLEKAYNKHNDKDIPHLSAHVLRHTGCTIYASHKIDIKALQYLMGHADASVTMNVYNHGSFERTQAEIMQIEKTVNG